MKCMIIAAAGFLSLALPVFAQVPTSNATTLGTETTSGNGAGAPSAATPAGQINTSGFGLSASPPAVSSQSPNPLTPAPAPTADSSVTGTTAAPAR